MPEEVLVVFILSILSFTVLSIVAMTLRFKSRKAERNIGTGSSSLTTSELERMMKRAVKQATAPLEEKLDRLEDAIIVSETPAELEAKRPDLLGDMDLHQTEEEQQVKQRARARS